MNEGLFCRDFNCLFTLCKYFSLHELDFVKHKTCFSVPIYKYIIFPGVLETSEGKQYMVNLSLYCTDHNFSHPYITRILPHYNHHLPMLLTDNAKPPNHSLQGSNL